MISFSYLLWGLLMNLCLYPTWSPMPVSLPRPWQSGWLSCWLLPVWTRTILSSTPQDLLQPRSIEKNVTLQLNKLFNLETGQLQVVFMTLFINDLYRAEPYLSFMCQHVNVWTSFCTRVQYCALNLSNKHLTIWKGWIIFPCKFNCRHGVLAFQWIISC